MTTYRVLVFRSEFVNIWVARCFELDFVVQASSPDRAIGAMQEMLPRLITLHQENGQGFEPHPEGAEEAEFARLGFADEKKYHFLLFEQGRCIQFRVAPPEWCSPANNG